MSNESQPSADHSDVTPLNEPSDGLPTVIDNDAHLEEYAEALARARGSIAVDVERASGFRYGQRPFLVQIRRQEAGTALIDPTTIRDFHPLSTAMSETEWVLHAASQDLPGLRDLGLVPDSLFDTELAARLLGMPKVGLATVVAELLGLGLAKEHSAVDWSTRPLPEDWLRYAALDVEVLVELRDVLASRLVEADKYDLAQQEFEHVRTLPVHPPPADPWRRTSGIQVIRDRVRLAAVKELWLTRDRIARKRDIAPGRILPDAAIIAAAQLMPRTQQDLLALPVFSGKNTRRSAHTWLDAINKARQAPGKVLPPRSTPSTEPPPAKVWADKNPDAWQRLTAVREIVYRIAEEIDLPHENLMQPLLIRKLCWTPPDPINAETVAAALRNYGARPWQIEATAASLARALAPLG